MLQNDRECNSFPSCAAKGWFNIGAVDLRFLWSFQNGEMRVGGGWVGNPLVSDEEETGRSCVSHSSGLQSPAVLSTTSCIQMI